MGQPTYSLDFPTKSHSMLIIDLYARHIGHTHGWHKVVERCRQGKEKKCQLLFTYLVSFTSRQCEIHDSKPPASFFSLDTTTAAAAR